MIKERNGGKYKPNKDWGVKRYWTPKDWGQQPGFSVGDDGIHLGFKGSNVRSYRYYDPKTKVFKILRAHNAVEAAQMAWAFGYEKVRKGAKFK